MRRMSKKATEKDAKRNKESLRNAMLEMGRRILDEVNRKMAQQTTVVRIL